MEKYAILLPSFNSKPEEIACTFEDLPRNAFVCIVDDGSEIPFEMASHGIIEEFSRVKIIRFEENKGIEAALNAGLDYLLDKFDFIARMDIGDSCCEERFEQQVKFLEDNPDYSIVGCWANFVDNNKKVIFKKTMPVDDTTLRKKMFINNMFIHPSVMMRSQCIKQVGGYVDTYTACEDYDLFFKLLQVGKGMNFPYAWVNYEVNLASISSLKRKKQVVNRIKIIYKNFTLYKFGFYPYYGIVRNIMFLLINRKITTYIQKKIKQKSKEY